MLLSNEFEEGDEKEQGDSKLPVRRVRFGRLHGVVVVVVVVVVFVVVVGVIIILVVVGIGNGVVFLVAADFEVVS